MFYLKKIKKYLIRKVALSLDNYARTVSSTVIDKDNTSVIEKGNNIKIINSKITLKNNAKLVIEDNVEINDFDIYINGGVVKLGKASIFSRASYRKPKLFVENGNVTIANNCIVRADILCHYGGELTIGEYTGINENTNIRCAEKISIGAFNMISYECLIFDNNTHEILSHEERRKQTIKDFPYIGLEHNKANSASVYIGNDVWVGQRAVILKGSVIEDNAIVGTGAVVAGKTISGNSIAVGNPAKIISKK